MDNAQATFKYWVKDSLAPTLASLGFKGSGQTYSLPGSECWMLLGIQKSTTNTSDRCRFTINLSATNKLLWSELRNWTHHWLAVRPSANSVSPGQACTRLGTVLPSGEDKWWELCVGSPRKTRTRGFKPESTTSSVFDHALPT